MIPDTLIIEFLILLTAVDSGLANHDLKASNASAKYFNQNSHEELHSKNETNFHENLNQKEIDPKHSDKPATHYKSVSNDLILKTDQFKNSTNVTVSLPPPHQTAIISEGGVEAVNSTKVSLRINSNKTNTSTDSSSSITVKIDLTTKQPALIISDKPVHKRIHGRPGVSQLDIPLITSKLNSTNTITTASSTATTKLLPVHKKKKPLFTMIKEDKENKERESFIESPTTGRDYVLPIVFTILSLPVIFYLIKIIYRRGTEFTERQQYHRMYLIDGMYNSR